MPCPYRLDFAGVRVEDHPNLERLSSVRLLKKIGLVIKTRTWSIGITCMNFRMPCLARRTEMESCFPESAHFPTHNLLIFICDFVDDVVGSDAVVTKETKSCG
jgi:hypothetical protein